MTKLTPEEIQKIVEQDLPGYSVVKSGTENPASGEVDAVSDRAARAEASTPSIDQLREKYLGGASGSTDSGADVSTFSDSDYTAAEDVAEDEIVAVSPDASDHPWDRGSRPKAAVISGSEKKVIGEQG